MLAEKLLVHLDSVQATGDGRWIARCPAHADKTPSLAVREVDDRLLIHCFAGCGVADIVGAVGLKFSDLFPPRPDDPVTGRKPERKPFYAADAIYPKIRLSLFSCKSHPLNSVACSN